MTEQSLQTDRPRDAMFAAGILASGVAAELVRPLRTLRETLAELVERLDRFAIEAKGPLPYPYEQTKLLREELAGAYLACRKVTRLADDLHGAVDHRAVAAEASDLNRLVEAAMNLARHRISAETEVFIDLGGVPLVRVIPAELILAIANLMIVCADSARGTAGAAISLKTRRETDPDSGHEEIVIFLADNGVGCPDEAQIAERLGERLARSTGGVFSGTSELGNGSVFELRLPVTR
ncbi:MAG: hypothetical protein KJO07_11935 [Deltaproteobacteria bacterium]|jgi:C4-dicarboxylate-specific signal transduction histidine kinase|nr:hypothetical protein [Deltaproteobacteria bacterium]